MAPVSAEPAVFTLRLLRDLATDVRPEVWDALVPPSEPFLRWGWLASLEESGCVGGRSGWRAQHLTLWQEERLVAACPLYLKTNSEGEFVFDHGWAEAAERAGLAYYPKLLVGVPFTPAVGRRFLVAPELARDGVIRALGQALRELCDEHELSSVHVNFCDDDEARALREVGFEERLGFQYRWRNRGYREFDDWLGALRHQRRKAVRREQRELAEQGVVLRTFRGDEIPDDLFPQMYRLYLTTVDKYVWGRRYLNERFFELLRERFRSPLTFITAWRGPELLAGTFNVASSEALYGRYWGTHEELRFLHFNVCYYASIEECIARGIGRFEPGAGGDFKRLRGFDPEATRSLHYVREPRFARAVEHFLAAERAEVERVIGILLEHTQHRRDRPLGGAD